MLINVEKINLNKIIFIVAIVLMTLSFHYSVLKTTGDYYAYNQSWSKFLKGGNIWELTPQNKEYYTPYGPVFMALGVLKLLEPLANYHFQIPKLFIFMCWQILIFAFLARLKNDWRGKIVVLMIMYAPMFLTSQLLVGQQETLMAILVLLALECFYRKKTILAGFFLTIASFGIKFQLAAIVPFLALTMTPEFQKRNLLKNFHLDLKLTLSFTLFSLALIGTTMFFYGNYFNGIVYHINHWSITGSSIFYLKPFMGMGMDNINQVNGILIIASHIILFLLYILKKINREHAIIVSPLLFTMFHKIVYWNYFMMSIILAIYFLLKHNAPIKWKHVLKNNIPFIIMIVVINYSNVIFKILKFRPETYQALVPSVIRFDSPTIIITLFLCQAWIIASFIKTKHHNNYFIPRQ